MEERITTSGVAEKKGEFLVAKRLPGGPLSEKWEFVGGKNRWGESVPDTLKREWMEELNLEVEVKEHLLDTEFTYKETHFTLVCHKVEIIGGDIKLSVHQDYKWVDKEGLKLLDFGKSDGVIRDWIIERYMFSS